MIKGEKTKAHKIEKREIAPAVTSFFHPLHRLNHLPTWIDNLHFLKCSVRTTGLHWYYEIHYAFLNFDYYPFRDLTITINKLITSFIELIIHATTLKFEIRLNSRVCWQIWFVLELDTFRIWVYSNFINSMPFLTLLK